MSISRNFSHSRWVGAILTCLIICWIKSHYVQACFADVRLSSSMPALWSLAYIYMALWCQLDLRFWSQTSWCVISWMPTYLPSSMLVAVFEMNWVFQTKTFRDKWQRYRFIYRPTAVAITEWIVSRHCRKRKAFTVISGPVPSFLHPPLDC